MALIKKKTEDPKIGQAAPPSTSYEGMGYDPERIQLGEEDTVEARVNRITSGSSPLIKNARQRAKLAVDQASNQRGTLNTSMNIAGGIAAAENATYDRALPIAQQDVQTAFQAKSLNQAAANRAGEFGAGELNLTNRQKLAGDQALTQIREQFKQQGLNDMQLQQLRGDQAQQLAELENEWGTLRQTSQSAAMVLTQQMANIGAILANPDMDANAKQAQVNKQIETAQLTMTAIGKISGLDFSGILSGAKPPALTSPAINPTKVPLTTTAPRTATPNRARGAPFSFNALPTLYGYNQQ